MSIELDILKPKSRYVTKCRNCGRRHSNDSLEGYLELRHLLVDSQPSMMIFASCDCQPSPRVTVQDVIVPPWEVEG